VTLGGGGGFSEVSHTLYLLFKTLFLILLEGKLCVTKQDKASKDTFFLVHLIFQSNLSQKISLLKLKNVTRGGGQKSAKKVSRII
jgi:hypothetical protein